MDFKNYSKQYGEYTIISMQINHAESLEELQKIVFPTLVDEEILHKNQYIKHLEIFPEGQFVILHNNKVIASTSTLIYNFDIKHPYHTFYEIMGGGWLTTHNPKGQWLYGLDVSVHPLHRGKGLARIIYRARHELVQALKLKGQVIVGMMSGYGKVKNEIDAETYFNKIKNNEIFDPTVGVQIKMGFIPLLLMPNYLNDPICDNYGILLTFDAEKII